MTTDSKLSSMSSNGVNETSEFIFNLLCYDHTCWIRLKPSGFWSVSGKNSKKSTVSLSPADFSGALSLVCMFSKNSLNIQLMLFSLYKWRNSFTHALLVTDELTLFLPALDRIIYEYHMTTAGRNMVKLSHSTFSQVIYRNGRDRLRGSTQLKSSA